MNDGNRKSRFFLTIGALVTMTTGCTNSGEMRFAVIGPWHTLHPGLQHTLTGDLVLSNQFEPLVALDRSGLPVPLGAKSWVVSEDARVFKFRIDRSRKFSDGTPLSARHYKASWEASLRLEPQSANSSVLDVLYKVRGFEDFARKKTLSGVVASDADTLIVEFRDSFRVALDHLAGVRYSAFFERDGRLLGTGSYMLAEERPRDGGKDLELRLDPNPEVARRPAPARIRVISMERVPEALSTGEVDALLYGMGTDLSPKTLESSTLTVVGGQDALHSVAKVNGLSGTTFERRELRLALQYLLHKTLREKPGLLGNSRFGGKDSQTFLPVQAGRLDEAEADALVEEGRRFVPKLIGASKRRPIVALSGSYMWPFVDALRQEGLVLAKESRILDRDEYMKVTYHSKDYDILFGAFSVANGDPDGIYHALGKSGAIRSPVVYRERVANLLEEGRALIGQEKLDAHYRKVSRAILEEVPLVHLGFSKAVVIYRNDRLRAGDLSLRRNEGHIDAFEPK